MALTTSYKNAINNKDVMLIKIMLKDSLVLDRSFRSFDEMYAAIPKSINITDLHDKKNFELDMQKWDKNYLNTVLVDLIDNFSIERIKHIKEVISYIYAEHNDVNAEKNKHRMIRNSVKNNNLKKTNNRPLTYKEQEELDKINGNHYGNDPRGPKNRKKIVRNIAVGGGIGLVATVIIGGPTIGGIAAGAVIGGLYTIVNKDK